MYLVIVYEATLNKVEHERRAYFWLQVVLLERCKCRLEPYKAVMFLVKSNYKYKIVNLINFHI